MSISTEAALPELVQRLTLFIKEFVEKGKKDGSIVPNAEEYIKWKLNDFEYTEQGVKSSGAQGKQIKKPDWFRAYISIINTAKNTDLFKTLTNKLNDLSKSTSFTLENFISKISHHCLESDEISESKLFEYAERLVKEINGEPVKTGAEIDLVGIALRSKSIRISKLVSIRQTTLEDVETEVLEYQHGRFDHHVYPSAIMNLSTYEKFGSDLQNEVEKALVLLRLFKSGSIRWSKYRMHTEGFSNFTGGEFSAGKTYVLDTVLIRESEEEQLKKFWSQMWDKIPLTFIRIGDVADSFRDIAYQRYTDALLENGTKERRISNAVMGLEGIFLRDKNEQQELSYRLRMRIAKVMKFFGYNPFEVKRIVRDCYDVRSRFVHGGLLSHESREVLEDKYGSIDKLLLNLLNYLRISLIITILMQTGKDEFVTRIDNSFLDQESETKLEQTLNSAKYVFSLD